MNRGLGGVSAERRILVEIGKLAAYTSYTPYSTVLTQYYPVATVDLSLVTPGVINSELTNGNFADGLTGWTYSGPVQLVERSLVFGAQN